MKRKGSAARFFGAIGLCAIIASCTPQTEEQLASFEIRGLRIEARESEYATDFYHKASILALGTPSASKKPYLVTVRIVRLSGGDPKRVASLPTEIPLVVRDGVGDLEVYGGTRQKKTDHSEAETWDPGKVRISITGFIPIRPVEGVTAETP